VCTHTLLPRPTDVRLYCAQQHGLSARRHGARQQNGTTDRLEQAAGVSCNRLLDGVRPTAQFTRGVCFR
jgi:hypothetical protein